MQISPTVQMASIGIPDTLLLMLLALIVFGPRRLPEIGRQIGKLMYEFRKVSNDFKYQMEEELRASEEADRLKKLNSGTGPMIEQHITPPEPDFVAPYTTHPVIEASNEATSAATSDSEPETSTNTLKTPEAPSEYRGEPRRFPQIQPPLSGEVIAAAKPYRNWVPDSPAQENATLSNNEVLPQAEKEAEPETASGTGQEAKHA